MDLQQALHVALDHERRIRDHYASGVKLIGSDQGKKAFETLAHEEQRHVDYLERCLDIWTKQGKLPEEPLQQLLTPVAPWLDKARENLRAITSATRDQMDKARSSQVALLKTALELEVATSAFYERLTSEIAPEYRALFSTFLEVEQGHVTIVQAELDALQELGFWFDVPEFSLEAE